MVVYDGQTYESQDQVPDLGSWECVDVEGTKRKYYGLSHDVDKLPKYDNLGTGYCALCVDTQAMYVYHAPTKTWDLQ